MDRPEPRTEPVRTREDGIRPERRTPALDRSSHHRRRASDVIRTCRESTGLDRPAFAAEVGVPEHILALWEDPTYEGVDLAILRRVARAAGGELELCFRPARVRPRGYAGPGGAAPEGPGRGSHDRSGSPGRESA